MTILYYICQDSATILVRLLPALDTRALYITERHADQMALSPCFTIDANLWTFLIEWSPVNDHPYGAIPGSPYWSHCGIGLMEPRQDRPNGAT